jgi:hypothetical protein
VSHSKEREEKICLNCNAELNGRFCHICGQENLEPKQSVWSLVSHFLYDITHFDGKFFSTVRHLVSKPGFLSKEYIRGRRASYLNPIKMYVFSSALFFAIFFSLFSAKNIGLDDDDNSGNNDGDLSVILKKGRDLQNAKTRADSIRIEAVYAAIDSARKFKLDLDDEDLGITDSALLKRRAKQEALRNAKTSKDSSEIEAYYRPTEGGETAGQVDIKPAPENKGKSKFGFAKFETRKQYDSAQKILPLDQRDGWFKRLVIYRSIDLNKRYKDHPKEFFRDLADKFIHMFPYMLFVSLPLYALFLKLLYIRRKQFYYVDHGIFLVHLYIFTFLTLLVLFSLNQIDKAWDTRWLWLLEAALLLYGIYYTVKAMRNFYGQGRGKTILKFILLNILAFISLIILFTLFLILTVFRV